MIAESNVETFTKKRQNLLLTNYVECKKRVIQKYFEYKKHMQNQNNHAKSNTIHICLFTCRIGEIMRTSS